MKYYAEALVFLKKHHEVLKELAKKHGARLECSEIGGKRTIHQRVVSEDMELSKKVVNEYYRLKEGETIGKTSDDLHLGIDEFGHAIPLEMDIDYDNDANHSSNRR